MKPDITHISQDPLARMFVGTHDELNPTNEKWYETGNFLLGVSFKARKLRQKDGVLRLRTKNLGMSCEGNAEPAENKISDLNFYRDKLNGLRNVAWLYSGEANPSKAASGTLVLFRLRNLGGGKWQDNRISLVTDFGHDSQMRKSFTEFSGWVADIEVIDVTNLLLSGVKLNYKPVTSTVLSALSVSTLQIAAK